MDILILNTLGACVILMICWRLADAVQYPEKAMSSDEWIGITLAAPAGLFLVSL